MLVGLTWLGLDRSVSLHGCLVLVGLTWIGLDRSVWFGWMPGVGWPHMDGIGSVGLVWMGRR